jgi:Flp pilus assembly pilin Flp
LPLGSALEQRSDQFVSFQEAWNMQHLLRLWREDEGQDIAEYAVMLAVILVIVVGTIRLIGSNANNVFSNVASSISGQ